MRAGLIPVDFDFLKKLAGELKFLRGYVKGLQGDVDALKGAQVVLPETPLDTLIEDLKKGPRINRISVTFTDGDPGMKAKEFVEGVQKMMKEYGAEKVFIDYEKPR